MSRRDPPIPAPINEDAVGRLREAIALLEAIDAGALLDALPPGPEDALRHQTGVSMLAVLRRELEGLACELQSLCLVQDVMTRVRRAGAAD